MVVPAAPGASPAPGIPPLPGARPPLPPPLAQKTSGLAIASLICSIGSFIIIPFGFVPGIICGHMAKKEIDRTPGLQGRGLARAGLIVGYVALGISVVVVFALIAFLLFFGVRMHQVGVPTQTQRSVMPGQPRGMGPAEAETTETQPDGSGWTMQLAGAEIPAAPVSGRIHGQPFKLEKASLENGWLKLAEGKDFFADREMDIVVFENDVTKLSGRTFTVPKQEFGSNPHIWMKWKEPGGNLPKQKAFTDRYAMRLEFGELAGDTLPGKVYLCLPDQEKSFLMGTFEAQVKGSR